MGTSSQVQLELLQREARDAVSQSTHRIRALRGATPPQMPTTLRQLDVALRGLQEIARLLEGVSASGDEPAGDGTGSRISPPDPQMAMALLDAHEQERSRLAEELHDGPAQALANAIFQTELVERAVRQDPAAALGELGDLRRLLQRELDTLRAYISQLRPPLAEPEDLEEALRESAASLTEYTGIPVDVRIEARAAELEATARNVTLRVAQEALRNIGKHSGARKAWLHTRHEDGAEGAAWLMEVGDDGRGFDLTSSGTRDRRRHFGLRFMRERSELLGAQLSIESGPASGTIVRLRIGTGGERS
ncbi:MAG: sensor histidine kinase [Chloroflexota bacterium]|nr:sensor histidine kinase [Chloroflexota bacterium]